LDEGCSLPVATAGCSSCSVDEWGTVPHPAAKQAEQKAAPTGSEHPSSNDDGAGKPVVPKQGELALDQGPKAAPRQEPDASAEDIGRAEEHSRGKRTKEREPAARSGPDKAGKARKERSNTRTDAHARKAKASARPLLPTGEAASAPDQSASFKGSPKASTPGTKGLQEGKQENPRSLGSSDAVARKLMLEDGQREQEFTPITGPDLGDMEM